MGSKELKKRFSGKGGYYKSIIKPYFDCIDETYKKGNGGYTKKWELKKWLEDEVDEVLKDETPLTLTKIRDDEKGVEVIEEISVNGIDCGNTKLFLPSTLDVNNTLIDEYIERIETHPTHRKKRRRKVLRFLLTTKQHLNNYQIPNQLLQYYTQSNNGRFHQKVGLDIHPIQFPKEIRNIIFGNMDLYYFDISNSHLSIMYNLGKDLGCSGNGIKHYLDNKVEIRNGWESDNSYGISKNIIKRYIISWLYGNTNNIGDFNPFFNDLGFERMKKIKQNDDVLGGLYNDIQTIKNKIVENVEVVDGCYMNVWGNGLPTFQNGKKTPKKRILPHILFGLESKIMETINVKMDCGMKVLVYDGYIGLENDVGEMNKVVKNNLDMDIHFDVESIKPPTDLNTFI